MQPGLRSLNVALAAAMVLGEALRQTDGFPADERAADDPPTSLAERKARAAAWFDELRDRICAAFERSRTSYAGAARRAAPPGRFERKPWQREPRTATTAAAASCR